MEFNKHWTKSDNDLMRKMIKEGKTHNEIIEYFGKEKIKYHPKNKFAKSKNINVKFFDFINEIKLSPKETDFTYKYIKSLVYENKNDIIIDFKICEHKYVIVLYYLYENNIKSYDILFTTKNQYDIFIKRLNEILSLPGNHLTNDEHEELKNILENTTNYNELYKLLNSISYILQQIYDQVNLFGNIYFSITETDDPIKIKLYKNIMKDTFPDFKYISKKIKIRNEIKNICYYKK